MAGGLATFLFVQYFKGLPPDLIEAARIEGASWWQVPAGVVMPLAGPVPAMAAIPKFLMMYEKDLCFHIVVQQESHRPVMVGLQHVFQPNTAWGEVMASLTLITVPALLFCLDLQGALDRGPCRRPGPYPGRADRF